VLRLVKDGRESKYQGFLPFYMRSSVPGTANGKTKKTPDMQAFYYVLINSLIATA